VFCACAAAERGGEGEHEGSRRDLSQLFTPRFDVKLARDRFCLSESGIMAKILGWFFCAVALAGEPALGFAPAVPVPSFLTHATPARCVAPVGKVRMNEIRGGGGEGKSTPQAKWSEAVVPQRVAIVGAGAVG